MATVTKFFVAKYRIYPTEEQKEFICNQFGACKYVYNRALQMRENIYEQEKALQREYGIVDIVPTQMLDVDGNPIIKKDGSPAMYDRQVIKKDKDSQKKAKEIKEKLYPLFKEISVKNIKNQTQNENGDNWLKNGNFDAAALNEELQHLEKAYRLFFNSLKKGKPIGKPRKKAKKTFKNSYSTYRANNYLKTENGANYDNSIGNVHIDGNYLKVPKLETKIRMVIHRPIPENCILKGVTISKYSKVIDEYYAACRFEYEVEEDNFDKSVTHIGLDYSQKTLYIDSENRNANMPRYYKESQDKLKRLQKKLECYTEGSSRYKKLQLRIAKLQQHIKNQRLYFLHNKSKELTDKYALISIEDLSMKEQSSKKNKVSSTIHTEQYGDVTKHKRFGKETLDNGWYEFTRQLTYKQEKKNHKIIKVDKFYPSSQICSCCGKQNEQMKDLSLRILTCKHCGFVIDRDYNAAKNIDKEGFRLFTTEKAS